ncbi:MAG: glycerophosphodiester phosphodiesterase family protein [Dehalococcoidia bacterium]
MSVSTAGREIAFTCHSGLVAGEGLPNTLGAIAKALAAGAARIEIDIHSIADGEYLVCHANRLEEATTSRGAVGRLTREQAFALRSKHDLESSLPFLSEAVALVEPHTCELQLDLKDWRPLTPERADALGAFVRPLGDRAIVSSGQDWNLRAIARQVPGLRLGFDPDRYITTAARDQAPIPGRLGAYGYRDDHPLALGRAQTVRDYLCDRFEMLVEQTPFACEFFIEYGLLLQADADGAQLPALLHERGIAVSAWTLDYDGPESLAKLERLAAIGVDRVTTNTARQFVAALAGRDT